MQKDWATHLTMKKIYFLGKSLIGVDLPEQWTVCMPKDMETDMIVDIVQEDSILVIGTEKRIDELRKRCIDLHLPLHFELILHDEAARQTNLEILSFAKIAVDLGNFFIIGDQNLAFV